MGRNATQRRNGSAPSATVVEPTPESAAPVIEPQPEPTPEPQPESSAAESATALDIAAAVEDADISKAARVYVDVDGVGRTPTDTGTLATVQREKRADGTFGEYQMAEITPPKEKGAPESVQRYSIARVQRLKDALASAGVTVLR